MSSKDLNIAAPVLNTARLARKLLAASKAPTTSPDISAWGTVITVETMGAAPDCTGPGGKSAVILAAEAPNERMADCIPEVAIDMASMGVLTQEWIGTLPTGQREFY